MTTIKVGDPAAAIASAERRWRTEFVRRDFALSLERHCRGTGAVELDLTLGGPPAG